jgi:hypothetical protein
MPLIMLPAVKRASALAALAALTAVVGAGCGGSTARDAPSVDSITETLSEFEEALSERDLDRICDRIFSPEARRRAGGEECSRRLARTASTLDSPRLELVSVTLGRGDAVARVRASTGDDPPAIDSMRFVPVEGRYRIESLSRG